MGWQARRYVATHSHPFSQKADDRQRVGCPFDDPGSHGLGQTLFSVNVPTGENGRSLVT